MPRMITRAPSRSTCCNRTYVQDSSRDIALRLDDVEGHTRALRVERRGDLLGDLHVVVDVLDVVVTPRACRRGA